MIEEENVLCETAVLTTCLVEAVAHRVLAGGESPAFPQDPGVRPVLILSHVKLSVRIPRVPAVCICLLANGTALPPLPPRIRVFPLSLTPFLSFDLLHTCRTSHNTEHVEIAFRRTARTHCDLWRASINLDGKQCLN